MNNDRIYLTGYRGTGKTTVGRLISTELATQCVDLDAVIETAAGRTIRQIFAEGGEDDFRDWETRCLRMTADDAAAGRVISLGGGAILRPENRKIIAESGVCIWLTASPERIAGRIAADATTAERRPALTDLSLLQEIESVLAVRRPLYRLTADLVVDTDDRTPGQVSAEIVAWLTERRSGASRS
jgi:shikimate kinase